ncbi:integron integrase [Paenibacillus alvei]|uniref:integron integrase n=1 Tax=Paenibacillus alvei TaxID=44250 RepID=UPI000386346E|nr:integron integrase [Paenibacillus alvei]EPY11061.1 integron integrase [Paenibacillus alvei A6-6i-x]
MSISGICGANGTKGFWGGDGKGFNLKTDTVHSLRHSFATHLLEPVRIYDTFKSILASKFGTTVGYTHVSKDRVRRIMSPRDRIMSEMREDGTDSKPTTQGG